MEFQTWKTIKLGTGLKTSHDFRRALGTAGCLLGANVGDVLSNPAFMVASKEIEVELVNISVAELGFAEIERKKNIYLRAQELGLDLCPAEVGPQLRLQFIDEPIVEDDSPLIAMEPIAMKPVPDLRRDLRIFQIDRNYKGSWLISRNADPYGFWFDSHRFVFCKRKKSLMASLFG